LLPHEDAVDYCKVHALLATGLGKRSRCGLEWMDRQRQDLAQPTLRNRNLQMDAQVCRDKRGVALIFARTDTKGFHDHIFGQAKAIYFLKGRVKFHREDGSCPKNGPAAPSCFVMHTEEDTEAVLKSGLAGSLMRPA
jgi:hypothetical protein